VSDYHAIKALSNSGLKLWKRSKAEYYLKYIQGVDFEDSKDVFRIGSLTHTLALEPERLELDWEAAEPPRNKTTGEPLKSGKVYSEWLASYQPKPGKQWCTASEFADVAALVQGLNRHPVIASILSHPDRMVEYAIQKTLYLYEDGSEFAVPMKGKLDLVIPSESIILDIKTAPSELPGDFLNDVFSKKYHWQDYIYKTLAAAEFGKDFRFLFAVISKSTGRASLLELPQWVQDIGAKQVDETIGKYCKWIESKENPGDWRTEICKCE
jgi:hypothetical protein